MKHLMHHADNGATAVRNVRFLTEREKDRKHLPSALCCCFSFFVCVALGSFWFCLCFLQRMNHPNVFWKKNGARPQRRGSVNLDASYLARLTVKRGWRGFRRKCMGSGHSTESSRMSTLLAFSLDHPHLPPPPSQFCSFHWGGGATKGVG